MRLVKTLAALVLVAAPLTAQSLDDVLAKYYDARGGKDKIAAVQTAKITGKQVYGPQEVPFTIYWKRPNEIRFEFTMQGLTGVQAYDGKTAWMVMPFLGKTDPEEMTGDDLKQIVENADMIEGPLFNWKEKGHKVELVGEDTIEGTPAWKLKLTRKNGDVDTIWLDKDAYLEINSESTVKRGDQEIQMESSTGDYKEVDGILFPFSMQQKPKGAPQGGTLTINKIELGVDVPDSLFVMPEKKAEAAPAKPGQE